MEVMTKLFLTAMLLGVAQAQTFYSAVEHCPQLCHISGPDPTNWTHYNDLTEIRWCDKTTLFDLALHTSVDAPDKHITMRACTSSEAGGSVLPRQALDRISVRLSSRQVNPESTLVNVTSTKPCGASGVKPVSAKVPVHLTWSGSKQEGKASDVGAAVDRLLAHVEGRANCDATALFARSGKAVVGFYAGSQIDKKMATDLVRDSFTPLIDSYQDGIPGRLAAQVCGNVTSSQILGVFADTTGNIAAVQRALADWDDAKCLQDYDQQDVVSGEVMGVLPAIESQPAGVSERDLSERDLVARATCRYIRADSGDGCWSLAEKCGITQAQLVRFNGGSNSLCNNNIIVRQPICCNAGDLPDFSPQPKSDGTCFDYAINERDVCSTIAAAHDMPKWEVIEDHNKNTWGWTGCKNLQIGQRICLSKGSPPMPAEISNARCGPQVPGTKRPTNGTKLADLNPCPLNVCCNIWGQCGLTSDFCVEAPADTGAPGAAKPGSNGCISNCGTRIVNNSERPAKFLSIGYFEAWNMDRDCMHMDISKMTHVQVAPPGGTGYSHVHFAFPDITANMEIDVSKFPDQFEGLKKLSNIKRIVSFGGWAFSNDSPTYQIFRLAVATEVNRQKLARNVARFVQQHGLDGVDFDWEYPGATDIPGTPGGNPSEGGDYLKLLRSVRNALPSDKSLSIAAPASFWYLQNFPIKEMAEVLDYIVYMTYDLHGQWDAGNKWANPGCPEGNCLRHHVNMTETLQALSMITKAGVPAKKVIVGMPFYGRSFKMSSAGCTGPTCTFTGDRLNSNAAKGPCTGTAGYISNVEIKDIIADPEIKKRQIEDKEGDILIYSDAEYVGWLQPKNHLLRSARWLGLNFGGTVDWAVDLNYDFGKDGSGDINWPGEQEIEPACDFSREFSDMADLEDKGKNLPLLCRQVATLQVLDKMLSGLWTQYKEVNEGYDDKFRSYIKFVNNMIPGAIDEKMWDLTSRRFAKGFDYFECTKRAHNGRVLAGPKPCNEMTRDDIALGGYYMTMRLTNKEGFLTYIAEAGIPEEWITFDETADFGEDCYLPPGPNPSCPITSGPKDYIGYPKKKSSIEVPNPKDIVTDGIGNVDELRNIIVGRRLEIALGIYKGSPDDVIQVVSVPVFLLEQAIDGMIEAKKLGEKQEEMDRDAQKQLILTIVGAVLFIVPFVGVGGAAALGATSLARVLLVIGETANLAYTVYTVVDDPDSALMAVMGLLLGGAGAIRAPRTAAGFRNMAQKRTKLTGTTSLGEGFKARDDALQRIVGSTCRR